MTEFYLEGNNGGDIFEVVLLDDGRIALDVGHCCVKEIHHIVPVEWLTAVLCNAVIGAGGVKECFENVPLDKNYKKEMLNQISDNGLKARLGILHKEK